jgi:hypothetical protein
MTAFGYKLVNVTIFTSNALRQQLQTCNTGTEALRSGQLLDIDSYRCDNWHACQMRPKKPRNDL